VNRSLATVLGCLALLAAAPDAPATSIFVEGVITDIKADGSGYKVRGYDHYNHKRYEDKITDIDVKIAKGGAFILDSRLVTRQTALAVGRAVYAIGSSAGAGLTIALSEPAGRTIGRFVAITGKQLKLKVVMGLDSFEKEVALDDNAIFRDGDKDAARDAVLVADKALRISSSRPQTILAYTPQSLVAKPEGFDGAAVGVLKQIAPAPKLVMLKDGKAEEFAPDVKKATLVWDICGDVCHGDVPKVSPAPGSPAVLLGWIKRPGRIDWYMVAQAADEGRIEGVVKAFDGGKLTLDVLAADGVKAQTVTLDAGAVVKLDNKPASADEALKPGHHVSAFAARPQSIQTLNWPAAAAK
jgi:hypothetical protein